MSDHEIISLCVTVGAACFIVGFIVGLITGDRAVVKHIIEKGETLMACDYKIVGHVERRLRNGTWSKDV